MADETKRKVGVWLFIGVLFAPIVFAWVLLRSGYSRRARIISFGWLAAGIAIFFLVPRPEPTRSASEQPAPLVERETASPRVAYVAPMEIEERSAPGGAVVNHIYRGQRLEVFAVEGDWARVTAPNFDERWVRLSDLSDTLPADLPQPDLAQDPRLAAIPRVGEYGHTEPDVRALRSGALELLNSGQCSRIDDANKSVNVAGVYYVNCGENSNRFFRMQDGEPRFCGRSADQC